ncbi:hypothetical protein NQ314_018789 [Rhamnusium bicolor]|uniref:PiggyBac transposable element-derived protein domain-containing protein n=1 Tax=Rhamnusium bicolor TaxID=1586634 RepID=A0AAV8WQQ2_9CUCU|nr:hypothetical protein NQ314_018789 [Rhamnusium bicolor]
MRPSFQQSRDCLPMDFDDVNAFIGLLYMAGLLRSHHLHTSEFWSSDGTAPEFFAAVMSQMRFYTLLRAIRFDDSNSRKNRAELDNLAPIHDIFERFVHQCSACYTVGIYKTIDEMLEYFRGRCRFRQYIANKAARYGIKIYSLADARTYYTYNMDIYAGRQPDGQYKLPNDASSVVKRLILPIDKSGRNKEQWTIISPRCPWRMISTQITTDLSRVKGRPLYSSMWAYGKGSNNCILTSYVPRKNKNVILLSSYHNDDAIDGDTKDVFKPELITFYNSTKGGVDVVDRLKSEYSATRKSNRWPFTVFCTLLNIATINSQIIYRDNTRIIMRRRSYISDLQHTVPPFTKKSLYASSKYTITPKDS